MWTVNLYAGRENALVLAMAKRCRKSPRRLLQQFDDQSRKEARPRDRGKLIVRAIIGVWLVTALALHLAGGTDGLSVIILACVNGCHR